MVAFNFSLLKQTSPYIICKRLFSDQVRVRFAPSPTGNLHLGGLRTALYNHLLAKSNNGTTILRIEDTDISRIVPSAAENLIEDLTWCGITYDEGPYFQSERKEIYDKYAKQLIDQGDAYYCFCSPVRLDLIRREALKAGEVPKYDNCCRHLSEDEIQSLMKKKTYCIRFKLSDTDNAFTDLIYGHTSHNVAEQEGDPIILKTDGFPTYHFANVIDDHLMNITHVLRGFEWLMSTSKHLLLYRAFKWDPPIFGHLPLLLNDDNTKLSKRQGDVQVRQLKEKGYLPNSLINFTVRFGGGFDITTSDSLKIYTIEELTEKFDISKIKTNSCKVDLKCLPPFNRAEILRLLESKTEKRKFVKEVQEVIEKHFENSEHNNNLQLSYNRIEHILETLKNRINFLNTLVCDDFYFLWIWENKWDGINETYIDIIKNMIINLRTLNWTEENLKKFLKEFCQQYKDVKYSEIMIAIRKVLTGKKVGPGVVEIMSTLTKEDVLFRLTKAVELKPKSSVSQNS